MKVAYLIEPPFNDRDAAGAVTGCDIELARQVFRRLGLDEPIFVETEFADLLPGLERGAWQMTTGLFATEERRSRALFSRPIWALPDGLLIRTADRHRLTGYGSLVRDRTLRLATIRHQAQYRSAIEIGVRPDQISTFDRYREAAEAVRDGRVSAYASVARAHEGFLRRNPGSEMTWLVVPASEKPAAFGCFAFAKANAGLRDAVDGALNGMIGSQAHRELMAGFGFSDDEVDLLT
ncbi:transporter substrate-binding domain-containing protein [Roseobacter sinensis]|uniref:Transporter substrate-binding domain-containing protein n=1 Tax=Roseobacter sinensis TaxID=2931391 RepID=A0ABT3BIB7_9RHOB|nr:transporter substrate-binding domain-containing protein [Roseobacter sp. WL0113]MCV3273313.1 transporter substrate-binding domain-containing protein [Roseobacter sp. WL0113]